MNILLRCSILGVALLLASPSHAFFGFGKSKPKKPVHFVVEMSISGSYPDRQGSPSLFSSDRKSYSRLLRRIQRMQDDKRVKAVIFRFGGLRVGFAKAEGIRQAIARLGKAGKKTHAILQSAATPDYLAAMGCQKLHMTPAGMLYMPGIRVERLYFKRLLENLGMAADFVTVGNFKTAPEPYMRETMSAASRKQTNRLIGDLYKYMVEQIAQGRKLKAEQVKAIIDKGLWLPKAAKEAKLIDGVAYLHAVRTSLQKQIPQRPLRFVRGYGKIKRKRPTSLFSLFTWFFRRKRSRLTKKPKIAVIYAQGAIQYGRSSGGWSSDDGIYSSDLIQTLEKVRKLKNLRAVVLRVNSPGGSALASDLIWRKLEQLKKRVPLFVSMGNVAASGGYYIAMGADVIVAQPTTITGSIGVFGGKLVMRRSLDMIGINVQSVSRGKHSGIFSTFSKFSPTERATLQTLLDQIYTIFTTKAAKGRKMKRAALLKVAGGQVWTGRQAKKIGLVDRLGSLQDTIGLAIKRTGLKVKPQIVHFPRPKSFFESLSRMTSAQTPRTPYARINKWLKMLDRVAPQYTQQLRPLFSSPMPVLMYTPIPQIILR